MMKRLLITGAGGFLGGHLCQRALTSWDVYGTFFSREIKNENVKTVKVDLTDFKTLRGVFQTIRPDAVIHAAAITRPQYCQIHRSESRRINVEASINIAGLCGDMGITCIFTSSDLVFEGARPPYSETDPAGPVSVYGEQKAAAEEGMRKLYPATMICRLSLMFGAGYGDSNSFLQPMLEAMRAGKELRLFTDEFRTPVSVRAAVEGIFTVLKNKIDIIHFGGGERVSRYDFGRMVREVYSIPGANLISCLRRDVDTGAPRPRDVSLNINKALSLGFRPMDLKSELRMVHGGK